MPIEIEQHFTIADVAKALRLSTRTIQRMIEAGKLRAIDLAGGTGKKPLLRIPASELQRLGVKVTDEATARKRDPEFDDYPAARAGGYGSDDE